MKDGMPAMDYIGLEWGGLRGRLLLFNELFVVLGSCFRVVEYFIRLADFKEQLCLARFHILIRVKPQGSFAICAPKLIFRGVPRNPE